MQVQQHIQAVLNPNGDWWSILKGDRSILNWPPDAFAVAASLLHSSGAYTNVIKNWPPKWAGKNWNKEIKRIGDDWVKGIYPASPSIPPEVQRWWETVIGNFGISVHEISDKSELCESLIQLAAAADEACAGVGLAFSSKDSQEQQDFFTKAFVSLRDWHTLCSDFVDGTQLTVLPKLHTPQQGLTLRSMSHYLALCYKTGVKPRWFFSHSTRWSGMKPNAMLNILLLPWPETISPKSFKTTCGNLGNLPEEYGFFQYEVPPDNSHGFVERAEKIVRNFKETFNQEVDVIVFPELSLQSEDLVLNLAKKVGSIVIAGIGDKKQNYAISAVPNFKPNELLRVSQQKHHRWLLDKQQVSQYGLRSIFKLDDPANKKEKWWEDISVGAERYINFVSLNKWLTFCVLICEDLEQSEPTAGIIRAVGPNLVIVPLQDGPQLNKRWSSRAAMVLADDPGSSVLTLTSLGMARLCRPFGCPESRVVALWKDPATSSTPIQIEVPYGIAAVALRIETRESKEYTADGRDDGGKSSLFALRETIYLEE